ncbi:MAG: glycine--tRNA ligase subunit beta [Acidobacteriaceae bacterium]|nr:glycine--tRNA ligase subunit beta [Acidobacteriaceae bacterium]
MPDFLLEIGCEEIPARMIDAAEAELARRLGEFFKRHSLSEAKAKTFSTPRRLGILIATAERQPIFKSKVLGPPESAAYKDGKPTKAAESFAQRERVSVEALQIVETEKGRRICAETEKGGRSAADVLIENLPPELAQIYWPKNMYWRKPGELFVRPVRWLVAMLDDQVIPLEFDGVGADNESRGHRILGDRPVRVAAAGDAYVAALREAKVLGREAREHQIRKALDAATRSIPGARWREDKTLLDIVVNLTEWPSVILGNFDREFLQLPEEVLVTVMRDHQKYFALENVSGNLLPHFLAVLNTDGDPKGLIRHGNERVLRARFNDARFFWETDQKLPLRDRMPLLKHVTFQKDLGSYYEKTLRVQRLCSWLCEIILQSGVPIRPGIVHKSAYLAKTDLTTELVKEFTELQGVVGGLYAQVQELDSDLPESTRHLIAQAIYDQYKPESMEASVPRTIEGAVLSIADKADTIAGMFALGLQPTGSRDPFALRRQANGIVKIIAEHKLPILLSQLTEYAREAYRGSAAERNFVANANYGTSTKAFFRERLEFYLRETLGFKYDVVAAVLAADADDVVNALARAGAVTRIRPSADFESISVAFKRIKNILRQAVENRKRVAAEIEPEFLHDEVERELGSQIPITSEIVEKLRENRRYDEALMEISRLRPVVDHFFDKVMVMVDDENIRANRLALLQTLLINFSTIADFSEIVIEGKS